MLGGSGGRFDAFQNLLRPFLRLRVACVFLLGVPRLGSWFQGICVRGERSSRSSFFSQTEFHARFPSEIMLTRPVAGSLCYRRVSVRKGRGAARAPGRSVSRGGGTRLTPSLVLRAGSWRP